MLASFPFAPLVTTQPRVLPEFCIPEPGPLTLGWLDRMSARPAVKALEDYRIER